MSLNATPAVSFTPSATKTATPTNYMDADDFDFLNQYLPDTVSQIHDRYGSGDITGLVAALGNETPVTSDNIKWTEEGRLEQLITGATRSGDVFTSTAHTLRVNQSIMVTNATGTAFSQGLITAVATNTFTALCGYDAGWNLVGTTAIIVYADSNEFLKGTDGMQESLNSQVSFYENTLVTVKEMVKETGSNLAQKTWLEVEKPNGGKGFIWFYKNHTDTEKRFKNAIERKLIEGYKWDAGSDLGTAGYQGTQGLFDAARQGNVFNGPTTDLIDFEEIIERLNAQGQLSENYLYSTTAQKMAIDRMLQSENVTGVSWGAFNNSEKMAINLEFDGFKHGGYAFYGSRLRYLDDPTGRGAFPTAQKVHGLLVPFGSKPVYDQVQAKAASMPMVHVRYRQSELTNRKYQMFMTGAQAPTPTSAIDERKVHFLAEKALCLVGRNNVLIMQNT